MTGYRPLTLLLCMRFRGNLRQRLRELASLRGAAALASIFMFLGLLGYSTAQVPADSTLELLNNHQEMLHVLLPWGIVFAILSTVLSGSGPALYFNRAEVNWLWAAPISRCWLVYLKLCGYAMGAAMTSMLLVVLLPGDLTSRFARFLSLFLSLVFVQTASTAMRMVLAYVGQRNTAVLRYVNRIRYGLLLVLVTMVVVVVLVGKPAFGLVSQLSGQTWVEISLMPFAIIAELMLHDSLGIDMALDILIVFGMLVFLTGLIVALDQQLDQHMLEASARSNHDWSKALRSGNLLSRRSVVTRSSNPPKRMGGVGPLLWSRWLYAMRSSGHSVMALSVLAGLAGLVSGSLIGTVQPTYLASAAFFASVYFLPRVLVFDFRGAPEQMERLRGLPLPAAMICLSQVLVPVILKTVIEISAVTGLAITASTVSFSHWMVVLGFLPVINFLIMGLDNALFLLRPTRLLPVGRMDFDFLGRTLFEFLVKSIALAVAGSCALGAALWVNMNWGGGPWVFFSVVFGSVLLICITMLMTMAYQFRGADITLFDRL